MAKEAFGSWMVVESRKGQGRISRSDNGGGSDEIFRGSRFLTLGVEDSETDDGIQGVNHGLDMEVSGNIESVLESEGNGNNLGL